MEPRHFDQRDEEVSEAPWGAEPRKPRPLVIRRGLKEAYERYRLARAARRGHADVDTPLDPIAPIGPINPVRDVRIR